MRVRFDLTSQPSAGKHSRPRSINQRDTPRGRILKTYFSRATCIPGADTRKSSGRFSDSPLPGGLADAPILFARCALLPDRSHRLREERERFFVVSLSLSPALRLLHRPNHLLSSSHPPPLARKRLGRLALGSELVRIRPNRVVSSVGRERTSATRDAASSFLAVGVIGRLNNEADGGATRRARASIGRKRGRGVEILSERPKASKIHCG